MENILFAGYGRACITPTCSVPLAGYGATHKRMSEVILEDLYATCIAFSHGEEKALLFTQDLIRCNPTWTEEIRGRLFEKTGVPVEHINICSTHTHAAPDVLSNLPCMEEYKQLYMAALEEAAVAALEDLAPATIYGARTQTENMNFVRHYLLENGTYAGPNFGDFKSAPVVGHVSPPDPEMLIVKLAREEKPSILLVNFQVHPTTAGGSNNKEVSPDFIGTARNYLEGSTHMHFAYFTGAAGNLVQSSRIDGEHDGLPMEKRRRYGDTSPIVYGWRIAQYVKNALPDLQEMDSSTFCVSRVLFEQPLNHDDEDKLEAAKRVRQLWEETDRATAEAYGKPLGISSVYHAGAICSRVKRAKSANMELNAVRIGDFAFVTFPYEAAGAQGSYVKEHSPFPMTMAFSCANQGQSYVPTKEAYEYGCYESYTSIFAKGTGENAAEKLTEMLEALK